MKTASPVRYLSKNGMVEWRLPNGDLHRENGPAVIHTNGGEYWYLNGKRHRTDGPALILSDGTKRWYLNDERHRIDGPAIISHNGDTEYWIDGVKYDPVTYLIKSYEYTN